MTDAIFGPSLMPWPRNIQRAFPVAMATIAGGVVAAPIIGVLGVRALARSRVPIPVGLGAGVAAVGAVSIAGRIARRRFIRNLRDGARVIDPGFLQPPGSELVSTGPGSLVDQSDIGREGARYVGSATTPADVEFVTGESALLSPIRVFVGLDAADSVEHRVGLAMAELRRTKAFDRSTLVVQAPAGTGYANSTPVDVVEILTRGDCASVAIGYGLLPSFLSLDRVELARQTQAAFFDALARELEQRDNAPRVLLYGESLGAKVQQEALPGGFTDLDRLGRARALWVGTPGGRDYDAAHLAFAASAVTIDRPEQLPPSGGEEIRVWFLEHDADPVVRFRPDLARTRPPWLGPATARGRGVPPDMRWIPGITWAQVLVDTVYATDVTPGDFHSSGHDYRADLGAVVTAAFDLGFDPGRSDGWAQRLEERLRELEIRRAERVNGTD